MLGDVSLTYPFDILLHGHLDFHKPITVLPRDNSLIPVGDGQYLVIIILVIVLMLLTCPTELWPSCRLSLMGNSRGYAV
jgi:hypothetical protein